MRRLLVPTAALALSVLAGCGGGEAKGALEKTTSNLAKIGSGDIRMRVTASAGAEGAERPVGFEVDGAFSGPSRAGELPVARLRRTRLVGDVRETTTFVSTGQKAFLELGGKAYELPEAQLRGLRATGGPEERGSGLQRLEVAKWARDPEVADAGQLDGVAVQRVTGAVEVAKALDDIVAVGNQLGAGGDQALRPIDAEGARRVERAVRSSRLEVVMGKEDRLLRRLRLDVTFAAADVQGLEAALGPLAGSRIHFEIDLAGFNRKVEVQSPAAPRPLSELPRRR